MKLADGRVLVAAGTNLTGAVEAAFLTSAELFDPKLGVWTPAASLQVSRSALTMTLLPDGKALAVGGFRIGAGGALIGAVPAAELFDPSVGPTGTWTTGTPMNAARYSHAAVLLLDGRVLVAGGTSGYGGPVQASAEIYDPAGNTWTPIASLGAPRQSFTLTVLSDGRVLAAGGSNDGATLASTELFDPADPAAGWTPGPAMSRIRSSHVAVPLLDGTVLFAGGDSGGLTPTAEVFRPATGDFLTVPSMALARYAVPAVRLLDGRVLICGNWNDGTVATELFEPQ